MMIFTVVQIDHDMDGYFNRTVLAMFFDDEQGETAFGKAAKWLAKHPSPKLYLGTDNDVYPKIRIEIGTAE